MSTAVAEKPKQQELGENREGRRTAPVQVEKELARMAAVVASYEGITQSALVSPILKPFLESEYDRVQKAIQREIAKKKQA